MDSWTAEMVWSLGAGVAVLVLFAAVWLGGALERRRARMLAGAGVPMPRRVFGPPLSDRSEEERCPTRTRGELWDELAGDDEEPAAADEPTVPILNDTLLARVREVEEADEHPTAKIRPAADRAQSAGDAGGSTSVTSLIRSCVDLSTKSFEDAETRLHTPGPGRRRSLTPFGKPS